MHMPSIVALLALALALPGIARGKDSAQTTLGKPSSFTGPLPALSGPLSGAWINGTSKGKTKAVGCQAQIKLKKTTVPDSDGTPGTGDEVICIADSDGDGNGVPAKTSIVFRGESSGGAVKIKVDLAAEGVPCPLVPKTFVYDQRLTCYERDPAYSPTLVFHFSHDSTQGVVVGSYAPRPGSGLIATTAIYLP